MRDKELSTCHKRLCLLLKPARGRAAAIGLNIHAGNRQVEACLFLAFSSWT